ncbi:uncharacterized protein LOC135926672 [Gordionus sp. m RMFG-2023]|uniref:uncharacterized protein LOC135926672 n=1 Tax=Gordionus sp. m RMFG-2023 TaxID=3053472 RepID=UPI0031FC9168
MLLSTPYPSIINHFSTSFKGDDTDKNKNHKNDLLTKAKLISKKLDNLNVKSAIRLPTSDNKLAPYDQTTYQALLLKHHPHDLKEEIPSYPEAPLIATTFTSSEVRKAILSFKRDSSPGVDGFRPIFLQDLTAPYITQQCDVLEKITQLINRMLAGGLPPAIIPLLYGAKLIALLEPNKDIRPIAIGTTWRRLTAKLVVSRILFTVSNHLCPNQLGVNVKDRCEVSLHMTRMYLQTDPSDDILIKIDFSNAFNSLKRTALFNPILTLYPEYSQFIFDCYASPSHLQFGDRLIPSSSGIQQGDPLGSFLFCLGINSLIQGINDQCKLNLHNWYIDDGILGGSPSEVMKAVEIIKSSESSLGLRINQDKSEYCPLGIIDLNYDPMFNHTPLNFLTHLGSPVGKDESFVKFFADTLLEISLMRGTLSRLPAHQAFFLLKNYLLIPKILYTLRSSRIFQYEVNLAAHELEIKHLTEDILNLKFGDLSWLQATLPTKSGGIGIRSPSLLSVVRSYPLAGPASPSYTHSQNIPTLYFPRQLIYGNLFH